MYLHPMALGQVTATANQTLGLWGVILGLPLVALAKELVI